MANEVKRLALLGSTGSIGRQTLDVVRAFPQRFQIIGLAAANNTALLSEQINEFKPKYVYCQQAKNLSHSRKNYEILSLEDMASHPDVDVVVIATSGWSGLNPTLAAVRAGKTIALSNKESLVTAGEIIKREVKAHSARILPVDSEHSALWQCLIGEAQPARLILTASGGPFLHYPLAKLARVTVQQALNHPSWKMGKKITIDSATLMNKGLEVIEAHWLFDMPFDNIKVVVHPQSVIHSMVEFADGAIKAQLSYPDMRLPIQYALSYPERLPNPELPRLDWDDITSLNFELPDMKRFPCLKLAIEAGQKGGTYPAVLCAADEVAVDLFLAERIGFTDIGRLVEQALTRHKPVSHPTIEDIATADAWAREQVTQLITGDSLCR